MRTVRFVCSAALGCLWSFSGVPAIALAQAGIDGIQPDGTLGTQTIPSGPNALEVVGGASAGNNLFHSFDEFSIPTGAEVFFNNPLSIDNIFTRVTGTSISNIDGTLRTAGTANFFLINPNGILFGPNATLDVGGSFLATTAGSIRFTDGVVFSTDPSQSGPLLTISTPLGLQFGSSAAAIVNQSRAGEPDTFGVPPGLQVGAGNTLALVGGEVRLESGRINVPAGQVEIGSVAAGNEVALALGDRSIQLTYDGVAGFQDILFSQGAGIDVGDQGMLPAVPQAGAIRLRGENVFLTGASGLFANASSSFDGGSINVVARRVLLTEGSGFGAGTLGTGAGGAIEIEATDSVEIQGVGTSNPSVLSTSAQQTDGAGTGPGGNITIRTGRLLLQEGGSIVASTIGNAIGGTVTIEANELVEVSGSDAISNPATGATIDFASSIAASSGIEGFLGSFPITGDGGNVNITAPVVSVRDGGGISVGSFGQGDAGNVIVQADRIELDAGGTITGNTTFGEGGNLILEAVERIVLENGSSIATNAGGDGDGGNITFRTSVLAGTGNSDITSNALQGAGGAIDIIADGILGLTVRTVQEIQSELGFDLATFDPQQLSTSDITAISQFNPQLAGIISIGDLETDPSDGLVDLQADVEDLTGAINQVCRASIDSEFIATGRGGLPQSPDDVLGYPLIFEDLGEETPRAARLLKSEAKLDGGAEGNEGVTDGQNLDGKNTDLLVEANGWQPTPDGAIELTAPVLADGTVLLQRGRELYRAMRYEEAIVAWQQALEIFAIGGVRPETVATRSNLALALAKLGRWKDASDSLAQAERDLLTLPEGDRLPLTGQLLDARGSLAFAAGNSNGALDLWERAAIAYRQAGNETAAARADIHRVQVLEAEGFNNKAAAAIAVALERTQPDSLERAIALRVSGDTLGSMGDLDTAEATLEESLKIARQLQSPEVESAALLSLGNVARARQQTNKSLGLYQQAAEVAPSTGGQLVAQLNQLSLSIDRRRLFGTQKLRQEIAANLERIAPNRTATYTLINYSRSLQEIYALGDADAPELEEILSFLALSVRYARALGDARAVSYAEGFLAAAYEQAGRPEDARKLTESALSIAEALRAPDMVYRWQWQLGRVLRSQGNRRGAIAAFQDSAHTLQSLRGELASANDELQFSFQEAIEPLYRQFIDLLLPPDFEVDVATLNLARDAIDALQLAELDNFFQDACLEVGPVAIDTIDPNAAVLSTVLLDESLSEASESRLELILSMPGQPLRRYTVFVSPATVDATIAEFRDRVTDPRTREDEGDFQNAGQRLYDWLIRPIEADLATGDIRHFVLIPDSTLRGIPLAALSDGDRFLVEKYSIAISPGLRLIDPQPLGIQTLQVLGAGLTEARQGFAALPYVEREIANIQQEVTTQTLLDSFFTKPGFQETVASEPFPIVHVATHGQFSSIAEDTFILTWEDRINAKNLDFLLRKENRKEEPIELLVLSACQTALGDKRAALGLAGIAVRAGARSTVASLWFVDDLGTSVLMQHFYEELVASQATKAEALRNAQMRLLSNPEYRHPFFWSAFVLVGNWL